MMAMDQHGSFKERHFTSEVILWALRWYLAFPTATAISGRCWPIAAWR